ncbi:MULTISPECIES: ABC transporter permease [unclassified Leifsonia]|uniref:ABC transporter permease n=1 Tax=unclassified Leifsonia TaxID=2663824 RepID=UPI0008A7D125|nr:MULTISPECIES: ABC transporter permease [unclassified Leifsonia]SEH76162.1 ABC-2 type transport system permease protein [Leifsonia sp. CL154]SFL37797.1 ABC-2 type transport system permease protein [Leifsonia sp. CL147]
MARHNLSTVVSFEFRRTVTKRRFWAITLILPILVFGLGSLIIASNVSTTQTADKQKNERFEFLYSDASGLIDPAIAKEYGGTEIRSEAEGVEEVQIGGTPAYFAYPADPAKQTVKIFGEDAGIFQNSKYSAVAQSLLSTSVEHRLGNPTDVAVLRGTVTTATTTFKDGKPAPGFAAILPALLFLAAFFIVIVFLGNQMLNSTLEEKENRVTEMILTTINPTNLLIGKVISLFAVGIIQIAVFALPTLIGYVFFREQLQIPSLDLSTLVFEPQKMIVGTLILIGGFALFTGALVAVGAIMPTAKDAAPLFSVVVFAVIIPLYASGFAISSPQSPIVQVLAFFPFTAPITALILNAFGSLPLWQAIVIIVELFVLSVVVLRIAVRLFRYGSIEYSSKVKIRDVLGRRPEKAEPQPMGLS